MELAASGDVKDIARRARGCRGGVGRLLQSKVEAARGKELLNGGGMTDRRSFKLVHTDGKQVCAAGWWRTSGGVCEGGVESGMGING